MGKMSDLDIVLKNAVAKIEKAVEPARTAEEAAKMGLAAILAELSIINFAALKSTGGSKSPMLYIVVIHHEYGENANVFSSREEADQWVYEYVEEWWPNMAFTRDEEMPDDHKEAIEMYFDLVEQESRDIIPVMLVEP